MAKKRKAPAVAPGADKSRVEAVLELLADDQAKLLRAALGQLRPAELEQLVAAALWAAAIAGDLAAAKLWLAECRARGPADDPPAGSAPEAGPAGLPFDLQLD